MASEILGDTIGKLDPIYSRPAHREARQDSKSFTLDFEKSYIDQTLSKMKYQVENGNLLQGLYCLYSICIRVKKQQIDSCLLCQ